MAFSWDRAHGGRAYNYTVLALCYRALELRGALRAPGASCARLAARLGGVVPPPAAGESGLRAPSWFTPELAAATAESSSGEGSGGEGEGEGAVGTPWQNRALDAASGEGIRLNELACLLGIAAIPLAAALWAAGERSGAEATRNSS